MLPSSLQQSADQTFAQACLELQISARITAQAVEAVFDWHSIDQTEQSAQMVADSLSLGLVAPIHLCRALSLLALDLECQTAEEQAQAPNTNH